MKVDPSDGVVPEKPNESLFRFRQPVVVEALQLEKVFYNLRDLVERVGKRRPIGPVAITEAGIVRSDRMESIRQDPDQIPILMPGGREAMQKHQLGVCGIARLPISDI